MSIKKLINITNLVKIFDKIKREEADILNSELPI